MIESAGNETRILFASDGPRAEHEAFCKDKKIATSEYILSRELGLIYEVSKLPFAVLIDSSGTIRAKGLVNTREHVESLFEAERLGVASLQEYLDDESKMNELVVTQKTKEAKANRFKKGAA
jgi:methylamine dehydrogenase accessory protein MauD